MPGGLNPQAHAAKSEARPVFGHSREFMGALSVSGPRNRFNKLVVTKISALLLECARSLAPQLDGSAKMRGVSKTTFEFN
jgi:DNA-binding IclR family transcriptional regulator